MAEATIGSTSVRRAARPTSFGSPSHRSSERGSTLDSGASVSITLSAIPVPSQLPACVGAAFLALFVSGLVIAADVELDGPAPEDGRPLSTRYEPAGAGAAAPYDLRAERAEHERRRSARQPYAITPFLLHDYLQAHHPDADFVWQRPIGRSFFFVGTRNPNPDSLQQVYVGWQSYSDGLQWGFTEIEIVRHLGTDPFQIVADAAVREKIRTAVGPPGKAGDWDVFLERSRQVFTDQGAERLVFEPAGHDAVRYGVWADGRTRFFTREGTPH